MIPEQMYQEILENKDFNDFNKLKLQLARKYKLKRIPKDSEILFSLNAKDYQLLKNKFVIKPTRIISGVSPIGLFAKPARCPHGVCLFCCGGLNSYFGSVPQSYTGNEPGTRRAIRNHYDPYLQIMSRIDRLHKKLLELKGISNLEYEKERNEKSKIRCVSLLIETKPDYGKLSHGNEMLEYGTTKVELGVQTIYDDVLKFTHRGHNLQDSIESIQILKDLGFKLNFHMMPGLPNVTKEQDINAFKEIFENPSYKPDMLKIYPCLVMPGTPLYRLWKLGKYKPISTEEA